MSFAKSLKELFGGGAKTKPTAPKGKTKSSGGAAPSSERAALLAEAMAVLRRERARMQDSLDQSLAELRKTAPTLLHDPKALARVLDLHRAHVDMRKMMNGDPERFLAISGMRELLGAPKDHLRLGKLASKPGAKPAKAGSKR